MTIPDTTPEFKALCRQKATEKAKSPYVTGTERVAFSGDGAAVRQKDEYRRLRAEGIRHVVRYTDQIDGKMVYVVAWPIQPPPPLSEDALRAEVEAAVLAENSTTVPLTEEAESAKMGDEGGTSEPHPFRGKVDLTNVEQQPEHSL